MQIVAGTYEGFCYGWHANIGRRLHTSDLGAAQRPESNSSQHHSKHAANKALSLAFGYNVHVGCMKCVAITTSGKRAGRLLVTGGTDERIRIYDLKDRTELGELQQHNGTVTCMEFFESTHLLTGSEDHSICIWRVHDWALLHVLGGHKGAITSLSIHPSGRMALSVSRDRTMRLWNLVEGRCAYIKRLQGEGHLVRWSAKGDRYLVVVNNNVVVYSAATAEPEGECKHPARVNSAVFVGGRAEGEELLLATCADDKFIRFFRAKDGDFVGKLNVSKTCSTGRVRDMCFVSHSPEDSSEPDSEATETQGALVTVSSTGSVNAWGVTQPSMADCEEAGTSGSDASELDLPLLVSCVVKGEPRFTCVAASHSDEPLNQEQVMDSKKRKQNVLEQAEDNNENESEGTGEGERNAGKNKKDPGSRQTAKNKRKRRRAKMRRTDAGSSGRGNNAGGEGLHGETGQVAGKGAFPLHTAVSSGAKLLAPRQGENESRTSKRSKGEKAKRQKQKANERKPTESNGKLRTVPSNAAAPGAGVVSKKSSEVGRSKRKVGKEL